MAMEFGREQEKLFKVSQPERGPEPIPQDSLLSELKAPGSSAAQNRRSDASQPGDNLKDFLNSPTPAVNLPAESKTPGGPAESSAKSKAQLFRDQYYRLPKELQLRDAGLLAEVEREEREEKILLAGLQVISLGDQATMVVGLAAAGALLATSASLPAFSADKYLCLQAAALALANTNPFQAFERPKGAEPIERSYSLPEASSYGLLPEFSKVLCTTFWVASIVQGGSALCASTTVGMAGNAVAAMCAAWAAGRFLLADRLMCQMNSEDTPASETQANLSFQAKMATSLAALGVTTVVIAQHGLLGFHHTVLAGTTVLCALANAVCMGLNRLHFRR